MKKIFKLGGCVLLAASVILAGCSKNEGAIKTEKSANKQAEISSDPVTLTIFTDSALTDDFANDIEQKVQAKFPQITLQVIKPGKGTTLDDLIGAGQTPDIIYTYNGKLASFNQQDLLFDLNPLVKKFNLDLNRFDPSFIDDVKIASTNNELYGIPLALTYHALYYNKDIFDKFGAEYPKDGMTWNQVVDLARKVTRMDGNTQYRGFDTGNMVWVSQPLGIAAIDYKTDKATVNNEQWKKVFEMMKAFYTIPGNAPKGNPKDAFLKDKTLAMYADLNMINDLDAAAKNGLNWDVVQYPSYPEKPNIYGNASVSVMMITKTSKYKDQAMQVLLAAASDDVQLDMSKLGWVSPLKSNAIKMAFGAGLDAFKGKNVQGIFKSHPVKYPIASQFRSGAERIVRDKFNEYLDGKADINTILQQTDEEINKMVESFKVK